MKASDMRTTFTAAQVKLLACTKFVELGAHPATIDSLQETLLIDGGRYTARSYTVDGFFAMWLISAGLLQFYNEDGDMLLTLKLFEETTPIKVAA